jgi:hypothetical protein
VGQLGAWQPVQQQLWQTEAAPGKGSTTAASLAEQMLHYLLFMRYYCHGPRAVLVYILPLITEDTSPPTMLHLLEQTKRNGRCKCHADQAFRLSLGDAE